MSGQRNTAHTHSQPAEKPGCTSTRSTTMASGARSTTKDVDFIANVSPGSITAPETWYSAFLDPLFGVE